MKLSVSFPEELLLQKPLQSLHHFLDEGHISEKPYIDSPTNTFATEYIMIALNTFYVINWRKAIQHNWS